MYEYQYTEVTSQELQARIKEYSWTEWRIISIIPPSTRLAWVIVAERPSKLQVPEDPDTKATWWTVDGALPAEVK